MKNKDSVYCIDFGENYMFVDLFSLKYTVLKKGTYINRSKLEKKFEDSISYLEQYQEIDVEPVINPTIVTGFDCNYGCVYCYQRKEKNIDEKMTVEKIENIDKFFDAYCKYKNIDKVIGSIGVIGGEPLLEKNGEVLEKIGGTWSNKPIEITTNGTYILENKSFFLDNDINAKVSIDGTQDMHYARRKSKEKDAYEKTWSGIEFLINNHINTTIMTVFNPEYGTEYIKYLDLLEGKGWLKNKYLNVAFIPEVNSGNDDIQLNYLIKSLELIEDLVKKDDRMRFIDKRKMIPGLINFQKNLLLAREGKFYPYRCANINNPDFTFLPNGEVYICLGLLDSRTCVGKFYPNIEIYDYNIKNLEKRKINYNKKCKECIMKVFCMGGCPGTAINYTNNVLGCYCKLWENPLFLDYIKYIV